MVEVLNFVKDFGISLGKYLLEIIPIVFGLIVALEILKEFKVLDFLNKIIYFVTKPLGISKSASMPLLIGFLFGLTYGAGAIIASYNNKDMNKKDIVLVSSFLCVCHGIPEDTMLFVTQGANGLIIFLIRFIFAILVTLLVRLIFTRLESKRLSEAHNDQQDDVDEKNIEGKEEKICVK